jgi:hypothetical protein
MLFWIDFVVAICRAVATVVRIFWELGHILFRPSRQKQTTEVKTEKPPEKSSRNYLAPGHVDAPNCPACEKTRVEFKPSYLPRYSKWTEQDEQNFQRIKSYPTTPPDESYLDKYKDSSK